MCSYVNIKSPQVLPQKMVMLELFRHLLSLYTVSTFLFKTFPSTELFPFIALPPYELLIDAEKLLVQNLLSILSQLYIFIKQKYE